MRNAILIAGLLFCISFFGCKAIEYALTPAPDGSEAPAISVFRGINEYYPVTWGETGLGAALIAQNAYLAYQKRKAAAEAVKDVDDA